MLKIFKWKSIRDQRKGGWELGLGLLVLKSRIDPFGFDNKALFKKS